tara:strand:+ start:217 stop:1332 length:1116 start_codon:yes stop_codon:yes gene_type:complete
MSKFLLPPGFKDEIFDKASLEHKYKNKIINLFQLNGYELVKPPIIEYANSDNVINSFIIKEKKEKKDFVIRNDMTLQILRLANARLKNKTLPIKLCYYGEVIRKKGSMLRPERQFLQVGAECIGENSFLADVEMLDLAYQALNLVGINTISIDLSSSEFLNFLLENNNQKDNWDKISSLIKRKDYTNCLKYIDSSLHEYTHNLLSCTGAFDEKKQYISKLIVDNKTKLASEQLYEIYSKFKSKYPEVNFFIDLSENNYLKYHTGLRFTFYAKNIRGEVARGGRYISKKDSKLKSSTGFTCYMDSIIRASSLIETVNKILIPFEITDERKQELIKKGYIIETFFGKHENIKKIAYEKNIKYCLINNKIISTK